MERRLTTIIAIDVVGYSRLMRKDEEGTLANLIDLRQLIDKFTAEHSGRTFGAAGDSVLAEFSSPVEAVRCSINIQHKITETNTNRPEDEQMQLRIGVNLGDVMDEKGNLYGDGINVAARLESLSEPGGMCISGAVYDYVRDRVDITFRDFGEQVVKNIDRPVYVWKWLPSASEPTKEPELESLPPPENPSVAVLPFENMSGDPEQEFLADGIVEEIITTLSKVPNVLVVARNSTFTYKGRSVDVKQVGAEQGVRYVLEGSVRKSGNRVRITAQLIDATSGHHVWADRYDRNIGDIFDLQDEMALKVATEIQGEILEGEMARLRGSGTNNVEAWVQQIRAVDAMRLITKESYFAAQRYSEQATRLDPDYSAAFSTLGLIHAMNARHGFCESRSNSINEARGCAETALALDPQNSEAYGVLGFVDNLDRRLGAAIDMFKTSLQMNPNHAEVTIRLALALVFNGQPKEAIKAAEKGLRLCPKHPAWYRGTYGFALRSAGRYDDAIEAFKEYSRRAKGFGHIDLAIIYVMKGNLDSACQEAKEVLRYRPDFTISEWVKSQMYEQKERVQQDVEALRQAGLPE